MRRALTAWIVALALVAGALGAAVVALNATAFGAAGFVRVYLEALARGDAEGALRMPGVVAPDGVRDDFLVADALPGLAELDELSVERGPDGTAVTFAWRSGDVDGVSTFLVERTGSRFGLFPRWSFARSPIATLALTVENDERFTLAGVAASSGVRANEPVAYALLVPGVYRVDHDSAFLEADPVDVVADRPTTGVAATLEVLPADSFAEQVAAEVHEHLLECATQEVLFPTGCPFGQRISNRVVSEPEWSIVDLPRIAVVPGPEFGTWAVPAAPAIAHVRVDVQSLFDGSVSTFDEDVPFDVRYLVTIEPGDSVLRIVAQYD